MTVEVTLDLLFTNATKRLVGSMKIVTAPARGVRSAVPMTKP